MSWRNKASQVVEMVAISIGMAPGNLAYRMSTDDGAGGPAWAAFTLVVGLALTSPITLPMFVLATFLREKTDESQLANSQ